MKNVRNVWLTENLFQLKFEDQGKDFIADFQHIRDLFPFERNHFLTIFDLSEVLVYPNLIKRQFNLALNPGNKQR